MLQRIFFLSGILLSLFSTSLSAKAQTEVAPYRPGEISEGITYFLPTTRLHIVVYAEKLSYIPGEYAPWAERFLEAQNVALEAFSVWSIQRIDVQAYGVADTSKSYTIKLDHRTAAPLVSLSPDGVLLGINTHVPQLPNLISSSVEMGIPSNLWPSGFKSQEIIRATSLSTKAELAAQEIYDLRENRSLLAKGQAEFLPKDGEQLRLMLAQLDEQEKALTALFLGTQKKENHIFTFDFTPTKALEKQELFRFSKHLGLLEMGDLAGDPIYIDIKDQKTLPPIDEAEWSKRERKKSDLRYCNPGNAQVSLYNATRTYFERSLPFAQFGRIEHLGGKLFDRKFDIMVLLSPSTGAIERIDQITKEK